MGAFLGAILGGQNSTLGNDISNAGDLSAYGSNTGENATNTANGFYQDILSGDPAKIGQVLSPQIQAIQGQGQQKKQTAAQFGNRGGGTNASMQTIGDQTTQGVNNLVSSLTGQAVTGEQNIGAEGLNLGLNANAQQAGLSQEQLQNFQDSVLGQGIAGGLLGGEGIGLGAAGKAAGLGFL